MPIIIIIISGATAQSRALASLTGFMTGTLRCGLSAHDQPVLVILIQPP
jgi:hypothetical protein